MTDDTIKATRIALRVGDFVLVVVIIFVIGFLVGGWLDNRLRTNAIREAALKRGYMERYIKHNDTVGYRWIEPVEVSND